MDESMEVDGTYGHWDLDEKIDVYERRDWQTKKIGDSRGHYCMWIV